MTVKIDKPQALAWARERLNNTIRLANTKQGLDREGWLEDGSYWRYIVSCLENDTPITIEDNEGNRSTLVSWDEPNLSEDEIADNIVQDEWRKWLN